MTGTHSTNLRRFLTDHFDLEELRRLSLELGVESDRLHNARKEATIGELVAYVERHSRLDDLIDALERGRPGVWQQRGTESMSEPTLQGSAAATPARNRPPTKIKPKQNMDGIQPRKVVGVEYVETGGGAYIEGDVDTGGDFAGRDLAKTIINVFTSSDREARRDRRNKLVLLEKVRTFWIDGVLEESVHGTALIRLGKETRPEAVDYPLDRMVPLSDRKSHTLPSVTKIVDLFDEMNGSMLILGAPGSGKTTTLLELARDLIARAETNSDQRIPVVLNLSSWKGQSLLDWLMTELNVKYLIPKSTGRTWLTESSLALLLDGLDEVEPESRNACVEAINRFLEEYGLNEIAVCCRFEQYQALNSRLKLGGAVSLQPLTSAQVGDYVAAADAKRVGLRAALQSDASLQELAQSPLMLSIMTLVYSDIPDPAPVNQVGNRRNHIFHLYVLRMLKTRTSSPSYTPAQTIGWLVSLAQGMIRHGQAEFLIENLQPTWLSGRGDRWLYKIGVRGLSGLLFLTVCILAGIASLVAGNITLGQAVVMGLIIGVLFLLPYWLAGFLGQWLPRWAAIGLTVGLAALCTIPFDALGGIRGGIIISLVIATPAALAGVAAGASGTITPVDRLSWSWKKAFYGVAFGLGAALVVGLGVALTGNVGRSLGDAVTAGLFLGPAATLVIGLKRTTDVPRTTMPNQGIRQSVRNALLVATSVFACVLATGTIWGVVSLSSVPVGLSFGLLFAFPIGLAAGLAQGGIPGLQHLMLRLILHVRGSLPWNLRPFLDAAAERILLRKVGGAYIFIHGLFLEYFAEEAERLSLLDHNSVF
jgi:DNA polymerase III delta prime subunit